MQPKTKLKRSLRLVDILCLGVNGVIGSGIFLLLGKAAGLLGPASLWATLLAGFLALLLALCFAEAGSRFQTTGGPYIYAREVFGDFVGFEVGWMTCCLAVITWAALTNAFTTALAYFIPAVQSGFMHGAVVVAFMTFLTVVNIGGAKLGALVSNIFTVAKLVPLLLFVAVGVWSVDVNGFVPFAPYGYDHFAETTILMLYAFVGFEALVVPAGEMAEPRRTVPAAMLLVIVFVGLVYVAVQVVALGTLPEIAGHPNPIAAAARRVMGPLGGTLVAAGIVVSIFGVNAGSALVGPRRFYALAEQGHLHPLFVYVHPVYRTPLRAILLNYVLALILALNGTFQELALISVVVRFTQYVSTSAAVVVLRRRRPPDGESFRIPGGLLIPLAAIVLCGWLLIETKPLHLLAGGLCLLLGVPFYFFGKWSAKNNKSKTTT